MEITEVRTREDMINNLKANGNYSKFKIRVMDCDCGLHIDRDQNAAINIRNEGLRLLSEIA